MFLKNDSIATIRSNHHRMNNHFAKGLGGKIAPLLSLLYHNVRTNCMHHYVTSWMSTDMCYSKINLSNITNQYLRHRGRFSIDRNRGELQVTMFFSKSWHTKCASREQGTSCHLPFSDFLITTQFSLRSLLSGWPSFQLVKWTPHLYSDSLVFHTPSFRCIPMYNDSPEPCSFSEIRLSANLNIRRVCTTREGRGVSEIEDCRLCNLQICAKVSCASAGSECWQRNYSFQLLPISLFSSADSRRASAPPRDLQCATLSAKLFFSLTITYFLWNTWQWIHAKKVRRIVKHTL